MFAERSDHFVDGESPAVGVCEDARDERAQLAGFLSGRSGFGSSHRDERPDAAPRLEHAGALELRVHARHGVGVHAQVDRVLADGRQLIARLQAARGDGRAQALLDLRVNRRGVTGIDGEDAPLNYYTTALR